MRVGIGAGIAIGLETGVSRASKSEIEPVLLGGALSVPWMVAPLGATSLSRSLRVAKQYLGFWQ